MPELSRTTLDVVIYQGDDRARAQKLLDEARLEANNAGPIRVGESADTRKAFAEYDAFVDEMAKRAVTVTVQAHPPRRWREICREHPARKDNETDALWGYDTEAVAAATFADSIIAPQFPSPEALEVFLDSLRNHDLTEIEFAICQVNDGDLGDPKGVRLTSVLDQISDESSSAPARLA